MKTNEWVKPVWPSCDNTTWNLISQIWARWHEKIRTQLFIGKWENLIVSSCVSGKHQLLHNYRDLLKSAAMAYPLLHKDGGGGMGWGPWKIWKSMCWGAFWWPKTDFVGDYCTLYFNKSLLKIHSLQDEFLWKFTYKMEHNAFHSISTCYIAVPCLAWNLIEL